MDQGSTLIERTTELARKLPKRKWVKLNNEWYLIAIYSKIIWAKISNWKDDLPDNKVQHITIHTIAYNQHHIKAECGGFIIDEAKKFAEQIAIMPFPEKLIHKK